MFPGETILTGARSTCYDCNKELKFRVLSSPAGYYVGTQCEQCGPHSRETGYFKTIEEAQRELESYESAGALPHMRT